MSLIRRVASAPLEMSRAIMSVFGDRATKAADFFQTPANSGVTKRFSRKQTGDGGTPKKRYVWPDGGMVNKDNDQTDPWDHWRSGPDVKPPWL